MLDDFIPDSALVTTLPCATCGADVFQRTARRKRFCSKACARRAWHAEHRAAPWTASRVSTKSVTVTYTMADGTRYTTVGYGRTYADARDEARERLPARFTPVAQHVSTPKTILAALRVSA